jgi:Tfp pilus assembly protein PilF
LFLQSRQGTNSDRALNVAAIEQLRQALALDPQFALARAHLAYRLMFLSNYDRASYLDEGIKERKRLSLWIPAWRMAITRSVRRTEERGWLPSHDRRSSARWNWIRTTPPR